MNRKYTSVFFAAALSLAAAPTSSSGFVYVATNDPATNSVIQFARATDGSLTKASEVSTGGKGSSAGNLDPLGSQDSLVLAGTGSLLLVVNAGDNSVSSILVTNNGLQLISHVASGGLFPNSVAVNGNLVYVLNAHTPNIAGFRLDSSGALTTIASSITAVPGGSSAAPHDIRFSPDGTRLLVTEGGTNKIDVFDLDSQGLTTGVVSSASAGSGPFGMRFGRGGVLLNAEASSASVSSYSLTAQDTLSVISGAVGNGQAATCWMTVTADGKFVFVSNTASGTLSAYQVSGNGTVNLESAVAASLGSGAPIDSALTSDGAFLYVVDSALGRVVSYRVHGASLIPLSGVTGLPTTVQGIAAQ